MSAQTLQKIDEPEAFGRGGKTSEVISTNQYVTFVCNECAYGVDIMLVREIRSWSPMTELPDQPHGACGVLDIRGEVIQVFDLSLLLGAGSAKVTDGHVVLVVTIGDRTIGILVDAVSDIIEIGKDDLRPPPPNNTGGPGLVSGVAKCDDRIVVVLDLAPVLGR